MSRENQAKNFPHIDYWLFVTAAEWTKIIALHIANENNRVEGKHGLNCPNPLELSFPLGGFKKPKYVRVRKLMSTMARYEARKTLAFEFQALFDSHKRDYAVSHI